MSNDIGLWQFCLSRLARMPLLTPTLDNADPLHTLMITLSGADRNLVITPGFYLHQVEVADQDPVSGSLYMQMKKQMS